MSAARKTFARILAINHSVEIAEVLAAVTFARTGAAELARIRQCIFTRSGSRDDWTENPARGDRRRGGRLKIGISLHVGQNQGGP